MGVHPLQRHAALTDHEDASVLRPLAACLCLYGAQAQAPLLRLLDDRRDPVAVSVATAVSTVGDLEAVSPLLARMEGMTRTAALKIPCSTAIATIQERHGRGEHGALALTEEDQGGGLGLAECIRSQTTFHYADGPTRAARNCTGTDHVGRECGR
jgi:hypothetical protein